MSVIAIEEHWNLAALTSAVKALPEHRADPSVVLDEMGDNLERLDDLNEIRIAQMDGQGIDMQILSLAPPGAQPLDAAEAIDLSRQANDLAAATVQRHPTRFRAFATLPMADPDAAVAELERAAGLGFVGTMVYAARVTLRLMTPAMTSSSPRRPRSGSRCSSIRRFRRRRFAMRPSRVSTR